MTYPHSSQQDIKKGVPLGPRDSSHKMSFADKKDSIETKSKKTTVNLSGDTNMIDELKKESNDKGQSLNAHINSILAKHLSFFRHALNHEVVIIPQDMWSSLLEIMDKKTIVDIMEKNGTPTVISLFNHNNVTFTIGNIIKYCFEEIALLSGCYSSFNHYRNGDGEICLVFNHKFNKKWSEILAEVYSDMIEKMLNQKSSSVISSNTLLLKLMQTER